MIANSTRERASSVSNSHQFAPHRGGFCSHAVHVSGQVAWDEEQRIVGDGDVGRQLKKSLENLAIVLASVGATLDQVGALRLYIKQSHIHEGETISNALKAAFGDKPPCATWIGVPSLARAEFLIEVEPSVVFVAHG
jgi:enamine deaminase RidA (YjgF/YER057c/UK114 family)